jgi:hypothetical protein
MHLQGEEMTSPNEAPSAVMAAIDKALRHVADICTGKERWTMRIPCQPDTDSDCVIADALMGAKKALQSATQRSEPDAAALRYLLDSTAPDGQWADQAVHNFVGAMLKQSPPPAKGKSESNDA